mmetsp:Transcript_155121/g.476504  ORF Transcript_155121/g.476504 Transcript_155121/m.476504 type:complete len:246 (+) Transcript_155121:172-909(+)
MLARRKVKELLAVVSPDLLRPLRGKGAALAAHLDNDLAARGGLPEAGPLGDGVPHLHGTVDRRHHLLAELVESRKVVAPTNAPLAAAVVRRRSVGAADGLHRALPGLRAAAGVAVAAAGAGPAGAAGRRRGSSSRSVVVAFRRGGRASAEQALSGRDRLTLARRAPPPGGVGTPWWCVRVRGAESALTRGGASPSGCASPRRAPAMSDLASVADMGMQSLWLLEAAEDREAADVDLVKVCPGSLL